MGDGKIRVTQGNDGERDPMRFGAGMSEGYGKTRLTQGNEGERDPMGLEERVRGQENESDTGE